MPDELVDVRLPVAEVTTLDEVLELACPPATSGVGELEWPKEVRGLKAKLAGTSSGHQSQDAHLLEVGAGSEDLVHEILNGEDIVLAESLLDDGVVGKGDALLVDLAVSALVDQLTDRLQVGLANVLNERMS